MTMVFHGAGGPDSYTSELMSKVEEVRGEHAGAIRCRNDDFSRRTRAAHEPATRFSLTHCLLCSQEASKNGGYCHFVDWSEYSTNLFKAAFNGQAVGKHAARSLRELLGEGEEPNVHLVGIR